MHVVARRLREAGLAVRELPGEILVWHSREPERGQVSVMLDDPEDPFVYREHTARDYVDIDYPRTDEDAAAIAAQVLALIGGARADRPLRVTGPGESCEEAALLIRDLAAFWHVWYAEGWHAAPYSADRSLIESASAAVLRDQAEAEMTDRIPQLRAQLAAAEKAAERLLTRQPDLADAEEGR